MILSAFAGRLIVLHTFVYYPIPPTDWPQKKWGAAKATVIDVVDYGKEYEDVQISNRLPVLAIRRRRDANDASPYPAVVVWIDSGDHPSQLALARPDDTMMKVINEFLDIRPRPRPRRRLWRRTDDE